MANDLVRVLTTRDVFEGAIARSRLEDEGIPVMTNGGEGPYRMGPVHLFVPVEFEVQARLVLDSVGAEVLPEPWPEPGPTPQDDAFPEGRGEGNAVEPGDRA